MHPTSRWMHPAKRRMDKLAVGRASGELPDASGGRVTHPTDESGEALDGEAGWFPRPVSCRMDPAVRWTHPRRSAGWRNRLLGASGELPDRSGGRWTHPTDRWTHPAKALDGETGLVTTSGALPEPSGGPGDAVQGLLDSSGEPLAGETGPACTFGALGDVSKGTPETSGEPLRPPVNDGKDQARKFLRGRLPRSGGGLRIRKGLAGR
jgi:hypothetical protein